jgi:hypothetical protein
MARQAGGPTQWFGIFHDAASLPHTNHTVAHLSCLMPGRWTCRPKLCLSPIRLSLRAQCRQSSAHVPGRILRGRDLGPTREDAHQTFRLRRDETAKELPLSPLLDPLVVDERSRFEQTKERPKFAEFTPFQKKLWMNPFGMHIPVLSQYMCLTVQPTRWRHLFAIVARYKSCSPPLSWCLSTPAPTPQRKTRGSCLFLLPQIRSILVLRFVFSGGI